MKKHYIEQINLNIKGLNMSVFVFQVGGGVWSLRLASRKSLLYTLTIQEWATQLNSIKSQTYSNVQSTSKLSPLCSLELAGLMLPPLERFYPTCLWHFHHPNYVEYSRPFTNHDIPYFFPRTSEAVLIYKSSRGTLMVLVSLLWEGLKAMGTAPSFTSGIFIEISLAFALYIIAHNGNKYNSC